MPPLSLSDSELSAIVEAARPLAPRDRTKFVEAVAVELSRYPEIGPGIVGRVPAKLQRRISIRPNSTSSAASMATDRLSSVTSSGHAL